MPLPTFLVLGAARATTTSLHYWLDEHPRITMSMVKEPNFLAFDQTTTPPTPWFDPTSPIVTKSVPDRGDYERLFAHAGPGDALGDASPLYLWTRETPAQAARLVPDARLVAVVRNPIDRAWSHHLHIRRDRPEEAVESFRAACEVEMPLAETYAPYASGTHVLRMGRYAPQLQRWIDAFGRDRLLVLAHERLTADPDTGVERILDHLGLPHHPVDTGVRYNRAGVSGSGLRARVGGALRAAQPRLKAALPDPVVARLGRVRARWDRPDAPPPVPDDLRARLVEWYTPAVEALRALDVVDVTHWDEWA